MDAKSERAPKEDGSAAVELDGGGDIVRERTMDCDTGAWLGLGYLALSDVQALQRLLRSITGRRSSALLTLPPNGFIPHPPPVKAFSAGEYHPLLMALLEDIIECQHVTVSGRRLQHQCRAPQGEV
jgi:hypothetical protein